MHEIMYSLKEALHRFKWNDTIGSIPFRIMRRAKLSYLSIVVSWWSSIIMKLMYDSSHIDEFSVLIPNWSDYLFISTQLTDQ